MAEQQMGADAEQGQLRRQQFQCSAVCVANAHDSFAAMGEEQGRLGRHA